MSAYKGDDMIYRATWICADDRNKYGYFRFAIVKDDNTIKELSRNMEGTSGDFYIRTKSSIKFVPDDLVVFRGVKYEITVVDGNRKEESEQAYYRFARNGNTNIYLTLRKMG